MRNNSEQVETGSGQQGSGIRSTAEAVEMLRSSRWVMQSLDDGSFDISCHLQKLLFYTELILDMVEKTDCGAAIGSGIDYLIEDIQRGLAVLPGKVWLQAPKQLGQGGVA